MADGTIIIEAEDIIASGFVTESSGPASGGQVASLFNSGHTTGALNYTFDGADGAYSLTIAAFDENDGASSLDVLVNGELVASFTLDGATSSGAMTANNLVQLTIDGLELSAGDLIQVVGAQEAAEWVRIDNLTFTPEDAGGTPTPTPTPNPSVEVEAEDIIDSGYVVASSGDASGGQYASLFNGDVDGSATSGTLRYTFNGADDTYNLDLTVFDENDGASTLDVYVNGTLVSTVTMDAASSSSAVTAGNRLVYTVEGLDLVSGDVVEIVGARDVAEWARVDKIAFVPTSGSGGPTNTAPTGALADVASDVGAPTVIDLDAAFSDAEGDALTYTISGAGASIASLSGSSLTINPTTAGSFDITVTANDGSVDSSPVTFTVTATDVGGGPVGEPFSVEAEDIIDSGYVVASHSSASGGEYASLFNGTVDGSAATGTLAYTFAGETGDYNLDLTVYDENDGASQLSVYVNGTLIQTIVMDQATGSGGVNANSQVTVSLTNLSLANGDLIEIVGARDNAEWARVDKLTFVPLSDTGGPTNTAPTGTLADISLVVGTPTVIDLDTAFTDADGDVLTYSISGSGASAATLSGSTLTIDPSVAGAFDITVTANDGSDDSAPVTFTATATSPTPADEFEIEAENIISSGFIAESAGVASNGQVASLFNSGSTNGALSYTFAGADGIYKIDLAAFDENDGVSSIDILVNGEIVSTISLNENTGAGWVTNSSARTYTVADLELQTGDVISVEAAQGGDEWARIDKLTITKTGDIIVPSNTAPTGTLADFQTKIGESLTIDLTTAFSDAEGDPMTFAISGPATAFVSLNGANLVVNPTDPSTFGEFNLTVIANDGELNSSPVTLTISVPEPNDAPIGTPTAVLEDGTEDIGYLISEAELLQGITDPDGDALSVSAISSSAGVVTAAGGGNWVLVAGDDVNGEVTLTYTVTDARGESLENLTQTVTLSPANDAPVINDPTGFIPDVDEDGTVTIGVSELQTKLAALVTDVDGDTPTVTLTLNYPAGSGIASEIIVVDPSQPLNWAPATDFNGVVTVDVLADDGSGEPNATATSQFNITVAPVNDAPMVVDETAFDIGNIEVGTPETIDLNAAFGDVEGDALTFAVSGPGAASASLNGGILTIDPSAEGDIELTVVASDESADSAPYTFIVPAVPPNAPPVGFMPDFTVYVGSQIVIDLSSAFSDINGDEISYSISGDGLAFSSLDGDLLSITPTDRNIWGEFDITIAATDGIEAGQPVTFTVNVPDPNLAPVGVPTAVLADGVEDVAYLIQEADLLQGITDPDGDTLSVTAISSSDGAVTSNGDGTFTLTAPQDFNGAVTLTYTVNDGLTGYLYDLTQTVNLAPANDAPTIGDSTGFIPDVDEGGTVVLSAQQISDKLAALVSDIDGDATTVSLTLVYPAGSGIPDETIALDPTQPLIWSPPGDFNGDVTVTMTADDGTGEPNATTTSQFTITVGPTNDAPVIGDLSGFDAAVDGDEDTALSISVADLNTHLISQLSDIDGDDLSVSLVFNYPPASGIAQETVVVDPTQPLNWTPAQDFNGDIQVTVLVDDGQGEANSVVTSSVTLTVAPTNDAPTAANDQFDVLNDGTAFTGDVLADNGSGADFDIDGDSVSVLPVVAGTTTQGGSIDIDANGALSYTAATGFYGQDTFTYTISDGLETSTAVITFDVTPDDAAPVANNDDFYLGAGETVTGNVLDDNGNSVDWDPDGGTVSFQNPSSWVTSGFLTLSGDGTFSFTAPNEDFSGAPITFTYVITDDEGDTAEGTVTFNYSAPAAPASFTIGAKVESSMTDEPTDFVLSADISGLADQITPVMMVAPATLNQVASISHLDQHASGYDITGQMDDGVVQIIDELHLI